VLRCRTIYEQSNAHRHSDHGRHPVLRALQSLADAIGEDASGKPSDAVKNSIYEDSREVCEARFNGMGTFTCYVWFWYLHANVEQVREDLARGLEKSYGLESTD